MKIQLTHNDVIDGIVDLQIVLPEAEASTPNEPPEEEPVIVQPSAASDYMVTFDDRPKGRIDSQDIAELFGARHVRQSGPMSIVDDPIGDRGNVLRIDFQKGLSGAQSGGQWAVPVSDCQRAEFSFDVFIPEGFDFPLSWKMPGLFGGSLAGSTGSRDEYGITGWSCRHGVRSERRPNERTGYPNIGYGNIGAKLGGYRGGGKIGGTRAEYGAQLVPGEWCNITQIVDVEKGIYAAAINGKQVYRKTGYSYSRDGDIPIEGISFIFWYGGNGASFAAREDQYHLYDNFAFVAG